jgi:hypothetical protein
MRESIQHMAMVDELVRSGAQRRGFASALLRLGVERDEAPFVILPDAFRVDGRRVVAYEAAVTSHLSPEKVDRYAMLWDICDYFHVELALVCIDATGAREIDLDAAFGRLLPRLGADGGA